VVLAARVGAATFSGFLHYVLRDRVVRHVVAHKLVDEDEEHEPDRLREVARPASALAMNVHRV